MINRECKTLALPVAFPREANQHDRIPYTKKCPRIASEAGERNTRLGLATFGLGSQRSTN